MGDRPAFHRLVDGAPADAGIGLFVVTNLAAFDMAA